MGDDITLPLLVYHELEQGTHRPAGAASASVRSGEGECEEWRCLLVARLQYR